MLGPSLEVAAGRQHPLLPPRPSLKGASQGWGVIRAARCCTVVKVSRLAHLVRKVPLLLS